MQLGAAGTIGDVAVRVTDAWDNPVSTKKDVDFTLETAAMSTDGSGKAARVAAKGSNRGRAKAGAGVLKAVHLEADEAGQYTLTVRSHNRAMVCACWVQCMCMREIACCVRAVPVIAM